MASATYGDTSVTAGAPGFVASRRSAKVTDRGDPIEMHFRLRPATKLSGRVTNEDGAPVDLGTRPGPEHGGGHRADRLLRPVSS